MLLFISNYSIAKDPELNYTTQNKKAVVNFHIAVDRLVLGREKETVVAWTTTGEFVMRNFTKGQPICVVGRLQQHSWVDEATQTTRYAVEIVAEDIHFAGFKRDKAQNGADFDPTAPYEDNVAA